MTPAQYAAARADLAEAVGQIKLYGEHKPLGALTEQFMGHTEALAGHLALLLAADPDPFDGLTGPEAVGADPTR